MTSAAADKPYSEYNPFDPAVLESPFDYYEKCRTQAPVYRDKHTGLVIRREWKDSSQQFIQDHAQRKDVRRRTDFLPARLFG